MTSSSISRWLVRLLAGLAGAGLALYLILRITLRGSWGPVALLDVFAPYLFLPLLVTFGPLAWTVWRRPDRLGRLLLSLHLLLLSAGIAWFGPLLMPRPQHSTPPQTLRVISFNVFDAINDDQIAWLNAQDADIAILPEILASASPGPLDDLSAVYPYDATIRGSMKVFSRHPFLEEELIWVEDYPPGRLVQRVVIEHQGQPVAIYGLHLSLPELVPRDPDDTAYAPGFPFGFMLGYGESRRNAQIDRLLAVLRDEPYPHIVGGDFNLSEWSMVYGELAIQLTDAYREAGPGIGNTWPVGASVDVLPDFVFPLLRLDYVWHSLGWRTIAARLGPANGSDHLPLVVDLALLAE